MSPLDLSPGVIAMRAPTPAPCGLDRAPGGAALEYGSLGQQVRDLAARYPRMLSPRWPEQRWSHGRATRRLWLEGEILTWLQALGPLLAVRAGIGLAQQFRALRTLAFDYRLEPRAYYLQELYRAPLETTAPPAQGRYETKNWLFKALNRHRQRQRGETAPYRTLTDKLDFARHCAANCVPTPPVLLSAAKGRVTWHVERPALDCDLFVKPRSGKGARGTLALRRVNGQLYRDSAGRYLTLDQMLRDLAQLSRSASLIVQPHVANHQSLADMARQSLAVVRVITCLDADDIPTVTHGMLRVLGKLEPDWPSMAEFGAPIDLATGRLGRMTGDKRPIAFEWHDRHPVTGIAIAGCILPHWLAIKAASLAAHRAYPERVVLGWDIALTPGGVLVLEGNARPDVAFLQRVHRTPIGHSPMAPLLAHHLRALEADLAARSDDYCAKPDPG